MTGIDHLLEVMARLRDPKTGCAWDLQQDFVSIAPHIVEETYELIEAIESGDHAAIKDELGDVLFQTVFYAQIAKDQGLFDFDDVARHVADKMIERHPHVFGDRIAATADQVADNWDKDKEAKRKAEAEKKGRALSLLDGISHGLPAAARALKMTKRAAKVGFDWPNALEVMRQVREEIDELQIEIERNAGKEFLQDELGDVLFAVVNLARKLEIDPETALRSTNRKFERRFHSVEGVLAAQGKSMDQASLDEMERLWVEAKVAEKQSAA